MEDITAFALQCDSQSNVVWGGRWRRGRQRSQAVGMTGKSDRLKGNMFAMLGVESEGVAMASEANMEVVDVTTVAEHTSQPRNRRARRAVQAAVVAAGAPHIFTSSRPQNMFTPSRPQLLRRRSRPFSEVSLVSCTGRSMAMKIGSCS